KGDDIGFAIRAHHRNDEIVGTPLSLELPQDREVEWAIRITKLPPDHLARKPDRSYRTFNKFSAVGQVVPRYHPHPGCFLTAPDESRRVNLGMEGGHKTETTRNWNPRVISPPAHFSTKLACASVTTPDAEHPFDNLSRAFMRNIHAHFSPALRRSL